MARAFEYRKARIFKRNAYLAKTFTRLGKEIARCRGMLDNEKFISRAPAAKVEEEKAKLEKYTQMLGQIEEQISRLPAAK